LSHETAATKKADPGQLGFDAAPLAADGELWSSSNLRHVAIKNGTYAAH
jgi:hypothetical protein